MLSGMNTTAPVALSVTLDHVCPTGSKAEYSYTFHGVWTDGTFAIERITLWDGRHVCALESEAEFAAFAGRFKSFNKGRKAMTASFLRARICEASKGLVTTVARIEG